LSTSETLPLSLRDAELLPGQCRLSGPRCILASLQALRAQLEGQLTLLNVQLALPERGREREGEEKGDLYRSVWVVCVRKETPTEGAAHKVGIDDMPFQ
jgi:hypothetical protein